MCYPEHEKYKRTYVFTCCRAVLLYKKEAIYFLQCQRNFFRKKCLTVFWGFCLFARRGFWISFSNLNSTKLREKDDLSISVLWCEDVFSGDCERRALGTDQHSEMFGFCYSLPHYFTQSCCVSFLYHFLLFGGLFVLF